ncbi:QueT transporter family protein [Thermogladius sp. 4427co]|uniref:QueT transporter family protein n=1 Tax=Thermogladius sp. 4427co TaxID=3450718 RepID=UPI003F791D94
MVSKIAVAKASIIAGAYAALTIALGYWSYGILQFRIADVMLVLPYLESMGVESIIGLTIGGFLSNIVSPFGVWDWIFGPLTNLGAALIYFVVKKLKPAGLISFSIASVASSLWIAFTIGYLELYLVFGLPEWAFYSVLASEFIILELVGYLLVKFAERIGA